MSRWVIWLVSVAVPVYAAWWVIRGGHYRRLAICPHCDKDITGYVVKGLIASAFAVVVLLAYFEFAWGFWLYTVRDLPWRS